VIGRGLVMASQVDEEIKQEVAQFPVHFTLSMKVFPHGPAFVARVTEDKQLELVKNLEKAPDLTITFKHLHHAFLVFSFQESTSPALASYRWIAGGDSSNAIRLGRCRPKVGGPLLPILGAQLAAKECPSNRSLKANLSGASSIYRRIPQSYVKRSV